MEAVMATMVIEVYDALRSIGVAEDKATKAAEAMATVEPQFAVMRAEYRGEFAAVRSDMRVLKWQVGLLFAITGPTLLLLLRVAAKVGAFG
jgi:hypothetical protein